MVFFTKIDGPASGPKHLKATNGWILEEREYPEDLSESFLTEAGHWCVKTFLHHHSEDYSYNVTKSWEETTYMPIMPREIVIADGAVAAFIRHTVRYESFSAARMHDVSLLVLDPRQRKSLTNVIDQHSSENYDNDIYYIYTLMERSELPAGASVAASRRELENIIF